MVDDVIVNKAASIERCVARAREEYDKDRTGFATDFTRQDAAILNIQRACEAALAMAQHLVRREKLGVPQSARDVFEVLARGGWIDADLARRLMSMVGYRNIAVHEYQKRLLAITVAVIERHLGDFLDLTSAVLRKDTS